MDLTNIKNENGYVDPGRMLMRMHRFNAPREDAFYLRKKPDRVFAQIGVIPRNYKDAFMPLFEVYAGNEQLFEYIRQVFIQASNQLGYRYESDEWMDHVDSE